MIKAKRTVLFKKDNPFSILRYFFNSIMIFSNTNSSFPLPDLSGSGISFGPSFVISTEP